MSSIHFWLLVALVLVYASTTDGRWGKGCRLVPTRKFDRSLVNSTWPQVQNGCPSLGQCERRCEARGKACRAILFSPRTKSSLRAVCVIHLQQSWQRKVGYSLRVSDAQNIAVIRKVKTCGVERRAGAIKGKGKGCLKKVIDFSPFHNLPTNLHNGDECFKKCKVDRRCVAVAMPVGKKQCAMLLKPYHVQYTKILDNRNRAKMVPGFTHSSGGYPHNINRRNGITEVQCKEMCVRNSRCTSIYFNQHRTQVRYNNCNLRTTLYYLKKQCQGGNRNCKIVHATPDWSGTEPSYTVTATLENYLSVCARRCLQDSKCLFMQPQVIRNQVRCRSYVAKIVMLNECKDLGFTRTCHLRSARPNVIWRPPHYIKTQQNLKIRGLEKCKEACKQKGNACYALQYGKQCQLYLLFNLMKNECRMVSSRRVCRLVQMKPSGTEKMKVQPQTQQIKKTYQQCAQYCSTDAKCTGIGYEKSTSMCRVFGIQSNTRNFYYKICDTVGQCTMTKIARQPPNMQYYYIRFNRRTATPAKCLALCKGTPLCQGTQVNHNRFTERTYCSFQKKNDKMRFYEKVLTGTRSRLIPTDPLTVVKRHLTKRSYYGSQYTLKECQKKCQQEAACLALGHGSNGRRRYRYSTTHYHCFIFHKQNRTGSNTNVSGRRFRADMPYGGHHSYFSWSQLKNLTRDTDGTNNEKFYQPTFYGKLCDGDVHDKRSCIVRKMNYTDLGFRYPGEFNSRAQNERQTNMTTTKACVKKCRSASWCVGVLIRKSGYGMEMYRRQKRGPLGAKKSVHCQFFHFVKLYKKTCSMVHEKRSRMDHASVAELLRRKVPSYY